MQSHCSTGSLNNKVEDHYVLIYVGQMCYHGHFAYYMFYSNAGYKKKEDYTDTHRSSFKGQEKFKNLF